MKILFTLLALCFAFNARAATYLLLSQTNAFAKGITNEAKAYADSIMPVGANPSATIANTANNGAAATFMRSDASPALPANLQHYNGTDTNALLSAIGGAPLASPALTGTPTINGQSVETQLTNKVAKAGDTMTGPLRGPDGSLANPSFSFGSATNTGFFINSGLLEVTVAGALKMYFDANYINCNKPLNFSVDTIIGRGGSAYQIQLGATTGAASPNSYLITGEGGSGTDKNGGNLTIQPGRSTGTGRAGSLVLSTGTTGPTGASTANPFQDRARYVAKYVTLLDGAATNLFTVTLPDTNTIGMSFTCTVQAGDGTDFQSLTTQVTVDAVAKSTTITPVVAPTAAQTALAGSAGTLSVTYSVADAGSNVLAVKCLADTSFASPTYLRAKIVMSGINIMGAGTVINEL